MPYLTKKTFITLGLVAVATILAVLPRAQEKLAADYYPSYGYYGSSTFNGQPAGQIFQSSTVMPLGTCVYTDYISWTSQNVQQAEVTVTDNSGVQKIFATGTQGSAATPWLVPGDSYNFVLWNLSNTGQQTFLAQTTINLSAWTCNGQNSGGFYPTPTPTPFGGAGSGNFLLTSNNQFCVGQVPVYTITSSAAWANQAINWTSSFNGSINSQSSFVLDENGNWTASGNSWQSGDVGSWQKTAVINGVSQNLSFTVQNCGGSTGVNPTPTPTPINSGGSGSGSFTLTSNNQFCVGQSPVYTITASTNNGEQTINWTSSHGGSINNQTNFSLINGFWTSPGEPWGNNDVGQWQKTATINGVSQTLTFTVQNCGSSNLNNSSSDNIGGSVGSGSNAIGGSVNGSSSSSFGGSVGTSQSGIIGGSVGTSNDNFGGSVGNDSQTFGGSVGNSNSGIIGSGVN